MCPEIHGTWFSEPEDRKFYLQGLGGVGLVEVTLFADGEIQFVADGCHINFCYEELKDVLEPSADPADEPKGGPDLYGGWDEKLVTIRHKPNNAIWCDNCQCWVNPKDLKEWTGDDARHFLCPGCDADLLEPERME